MNRTNTILIQAVSLGLLGALAPAQAQLLQPVAATQAQAILKPFAPAGTILTRGTTKITLDVVGGRTVGVLAEASLGNAEDAARAVLAAWGSPEENLAGLVKTFNDPKFQATARAGFVETTDDSGADLIAVKLTGTGAAARWNVYAAVNIQPDSLFPATTNALGNAGAPNVIRIFSDFQCPYCKQLWDTALVGWKAKPAEYRVLHHQFPLSFHKNAFAAAEASECAGAQGKFGAYADVLFARFSEWTPQAAPAANTSFNAYAKTAGLNATTFKLCLGSHSKKASVDAQFAAGKRVAVQGTPTVFLNGVKLADYTDAEELATAQAITTAKPSAGTVIGQRLQSFR
ncbi:DsbA family protein [Deinococcus puniceus]|uniref:DSBA oxidoreductase n=1 Tax=Deinococcus puniceus TaxID=1182568 RepID=A0A172TAL6_9DEIO|nr:thioredoxin domain-containing protein [Deinococcus puniceus]ANE44002.1 DSBA oxidoreductase [Deinococcus puniceus]